jgi:acyl carrier protein
VRRLNGRETLGDGLLLDTGEGEIMTSTMDEVARTVRAIVAEKLKRPADEVPWDADLESELGIDSLVMIEINVLLEERFHLTMPEVTAPSEIQVGTVRDLAGFVTSSLSRSPSSRRE